MFMFLGYFKNGGQIYRECARVEHVAQIVLLLLIAAALTPGQPAYIVLHIHNAPSLYSTQSIYTALTYFPIYTVTGRHNREFYSSGRQQCPINLFLCSHSKLS